MDSFQMTERVIEWLKTQRGYCYRTRHQRWDGNGKSELVEVVVFDGWFEVDDLYELMEGMMNE